MTPWELAYEQLKSDGFDVYSVGQKVGKCNAPYVVIRNAGTNKIVGTSSKRTIFEFLCYVPALQYSKLDPYADRVRESLAKLFPTFISTESELPDYTDTDIGAQLRVIQYRVNKQIIR